MNFTLDDETHLKLANIFSLPLNHLQLKFFLSILLTHLIFIEPASCIDASIKEKA